MAGDGNRSGKQRVLIAGGGIAGAEAALALRDLAVDWVEVSLRDPRREFVFRPFAAGEPYGAARTLEERLSGQGRFDRERRLAFSLLIRV